MQNLTSIQYLRAFSMLFIVGYWHLFDYSVASLGHHHPAMTVTAHVVLALFVFMSGFLLASKKNEAMSAKQFYLRRLLRIYPLYALAVGVFFLYGINDGWTSVKALLGISMLAAPAPLTLWFVTMLVLFYVMTPLLLRLVDRVWLFAGAVAGFLMLALAVQFAFNSVDPKVMLYFPSFCLGMYCAHHGISGILVNPWTAVAALAAAIFALAKLSFPIETLSYWVEAVLVAAAAYLIFYVSWRNENRFPASRAIALLSYSSYAIYLFHRPIFTTLKSVYFPQDPVWQVVYMLTLGLALVTLAAWCLQRSYDWLFNAVRVQPVGKVAV